MFVRLAMFGAAAGALALSAPCAFAASGSGYSQTSNLVNFTFNLPGGHQGVLNFAGANSDPNGGVAAWGSAGGVGAPGGTGGTTVDPPGLGGGQLPQQLQSQSQAQVGSFALKLEAEALSDITGLSPSGVNAVAGGKGARSAPGGSD